MENDYVSMKPFEVRCKWWRPEQPSINVRGSIGFDGSDIVARMDDWVGPEHAFSLPKAAILHAETNDGVAITTYDTFVASATEREVNLVVNAMAVGAHLEIQSQQKFTHSVARINGLDGWWRTQSIRTDNATDGSAVIHCARPSSIDLRVPERSVTVALGEGRRQIGGGRRLTIEYEPALWFVPDEPQTIDWVHEIVKDTRQLLSLFCNQDVALVGLHTRPKHGGHSLDRVEWYWNRRGAETHELNLWRILLPYDAVENELQRVLSNWLSKAEDRREARALLFSTQGSPAPFLESRFLPIIQALEVYCRALGSEKYIAESEFGELKRKLFAVVPADYHDGLKQKLYTSIGYANELGLNDRILQLLNSLEQDTRRFVCQDAAKFARRLKDSRNYYTHYGGSKGKELKGKSLLLATEQASLLLKILLLRECGISEALIQDRLKQSAYHSQGAQIWAEIEKEL